MQFSKSELRIIIYCLRFGPKPIFKAAKKALLQSSVSKSATVEKEYLGVIQAKTKKYYNSLKMIRSPRINQSFILDTIKTLEGIFLRLKQSKEIVMQVPEGAIQKAKAQIKAFEGIKEGAYRYKGVEAWRGVVCELLTSKYLEQNYNVTEPAKGLSSTGIIDSYDMLINGRKVEIKAATRKHFRFIMPKVSNVRDNPKEFYIGVRYNGVSKPNEITILGYIEGGKVEQYPMKQNKGAPYYEIPLEDLKPLEKYTFK